jgi:hypothetical protein
MCRLSSSKWAQVGIGTELVNYGDDFFNGYAGAFATGNYDIAEWSMHRTSPTESIFRAQRWLEDNTGWRQLAGLLQ